MSKKVVLSSFVSLFVAVVVLSFNNCQPLESIKKDLGSRDPFSPDLSPPQTNRTDEQIYFYDTLVPLLQSRCNSCHALPRDVTSGLPAPLTLFDYNSMKQAISSGPSATNNKMYNNARGVPPHNNGDFCFNDNNGSVTPCKEIRNWVLMEYPLFTDGYAGRVSYITILGRVRGWALDTADMNAVLDVLVYVDGPVGTGTLIGTYPANGVGNGVESGHVFEFDLPNNFRDGRPHSLYIYAVSAEPANILPNMPKTYTAFSGSPDGMTHFTNNLQGQLANRCGNCHNWTYESSFYSLVNPSPLANGTAASNELINKAAGQGHGGGNICGNRNASPCSEMQQWWNIEFN